MNAPPSEKNLDPTVVRVQLSKNPGALPLAHVESRDKKVNMAIPLSAPLQARMRGRPVAFFKLQDKGYEVEIGDEARAEDW